MVDIGEYLDDVWDQFSGRQATTQARFRLELPRLAVECIVRAAFYASMIPDERRHPEITLMCYRADDEREYHFPFCCPYDMTAQNIAKLAHGVSRKGHIYCLSENGELRLNGYHVTFLDEPRHFGYDSDRAANPLKVTIRGPGLIEVSTGGSALVYRTGEIREEKPFEYAKVMEELTQWVAGEFVGHTTGAIKSLDIIFNDIAKAVVRLGHGGMLIFMKQPDMDQFSSHRAIECHLLRQLLIRYWNDSRTAVAAAGGLDNLLNNPDAANANPHMLTISSDVTMLENCIASIGNLAGLDGAIVLDYGCNVAAFNAIINRDAAGAEPIQLVDRHDRHLTPHQVSENRGSRHQSAMSFVMRVPNSFVFVISQDGGVSGFHNRGNGTVLCERGLRVLD